MRKSILLVIGVLLLILGMQISGVFAQEPTADPDTPEAPPIIDAGDSVVVAPSEGGVTVVQTPANEPADNTMQDYINTVLAVAALVASGMVFLTTRQRGAIIAGAETAESYAYLGVTTFSRIIQLIGGRPDVEVSKDPQVLARALRNRDINVIIAKDVDIDAVWRAYNNV